MRNMLVATTLATMLLSGCASMENWPGYCALCVNNYAKFYTTEQGAPPAEVAARRVAPPGSPQVAHVAQYDGSVATALARQGYVLIGSSAFTSGRPESEHDAIKQGIKVGADLVVILNPEYQGSTTADVPITTPTTTTSYTNGTATAYGSGGPVTAFGQATTTTYGTSTTYIPMTVNRSAYAAGYFVKFRYAFGANFRDLTDGERRQLQTNRGALVNTVVDNSPAYNSDILPGDVIVAFNGQTPSGASGLMDLINANRGRTVEVTIVRAGKVVSKHVSILD
jgi:membrane-associated protease RseP (regulator of RpoE activity)